MDWWKYRLPRYSFQLLNINEISIHYHAKEILILMFKQFDGWITLRDQNKTCFIKNRLIKCWIYVLIWNKDCGEVTAAFIQWWKWRNRLELLKFNQKDQLLSHNLFLVQLFHAQTDANRGRMFWIYVTRI